MFVRKLQLEEAKQLFDVYIASPKPMEGHLKNFDYFQITPKGLNQLAKTLGDDEFRYLSESCTSLLTYSS